MILLKVSLKPQLSRHFDFEPTDCREKLAHNEYYTWFLYMSLVDKRLLKGTFNRKFVLKTENPWQKRLKFVYLGHILGATWVVLGVCNTSRNKISTTNILNLFHILILKLIMV